MIGEKYHVIETLGQGGMGVVLKARNTGLDKTVAIKVLHASMLVDAASRARFELETKAGAKLSHPHLISVFDSGFTADGEPFLVMEYVQGASLDRYIQQQKVGLGELTQFLIQIAKALRYLHGNQIIHRDLKTSNIMVQTVGTERYAKLLDLGIAKVFSAQADAAARLTATGMIFGSPHYMSPEQCQGYQVDERSDVYSFGCVLYECLAGRLPFNGEPLQVMFKQLHETAPALGAKNAAENDLKSITEQCMAKDATKRFQSMTDLINALSSVEAKLRGADVPLQWDRQSSPRASSFNLRTLQARQMQANEGASASEQSRPPDVVSEIPPVPSLAKERSGLTWSNLLWPMLTILSTTVAIVVCINTGVFRSQPATSVNAPAAVSSTSPTNPDTISGAHSGGANGGTATTAPATPPNGSAGSSGITNLTNPNQTNPNQTNPTLTNSSQANSSQANSVQTTASPPPETSSSPPANSGPPKPTPKAVLAEYGLDDGSAAQKEEQKEHARFLDQAKRMQEAASRNTEATIDQMNRMADMREAQNAGMGRANSAPLSPLHSAGQ